MKFNTESMFCNISSRTKISNHTSTLSTFITLIVLEFKSTRTKGPMEGRGGEGKGGRKLLNFYQIRLIVKIKPAKIHFQNEP